MKRILKYGALGLIAFYALGWSVLYFKGDLGKTPKPTTNILFDLSKIYGQSKEAIERTVGKPNDTYKKDNKYPCVNKECQKVIYQNGALEVFYNQNKAFYVTYTILKSPLLITDASDKFGLNLSQTPDFKNNAVTKWLLAKTLVMRLLHVARILRFMAYRKCNCFLQFLPTHSHLGRRLLLPLHIRSREINF